MKLPHLERMLAETQADIRLFQSRRPSPERLYWNRILLYAWPPLTLLPEELQDIVNKLAPETEGLGLEQVVVRGHSQPKRVRCVRCRCASRTREARVCS